MSIPSSRTLAALLAALLLAACAPPPAPQQAAPAAPAAASPAVPGNPSEAALGAARAEVEAGRLEAAAPLLETARQAAPDDPHLEAGLLALRMVQLGREGAKAEGYAQVLADLKALSQRHPDNFFAHYLAALIAYARHDPQAARQSAEEAVRTARTDTAVQMPDPTSPQTHENLLGDIALIRAYLASSEGDSAAAQRFSVEAVSMLSQPPTMPWKGLIGQAWNETATPAEGDPSPWPASQTVQAISEDLAKARFDTPAWPLLLQPTFRAIVKVRQGDVAMHEGNRAQAEAAWKQAAEILPYIRRVVDARLAGERPPGQAPQADLSPAAETPAVPAGTRPPSPAPGAEGPGEEERWVDPALLESSPAGTPP